MNFRLKCEHYRNMKQSVSHCVDSCGWPILDPQQTQTRPLSLQRKHNNPLYYTRAPQRCSRQPPESTGLISVFAQISHVCEYLQRFPAQCRFLCHKSQHLRGEKEKHLPICFFFTVQLDYFPSSARCNSFSLLWHSSGHWHISKNMQIINSR